MAVAAAVASRADHREESRTRPISAAFLLGPATAVVLAMLVVPLILLGRYSLNRYDATELMIEAVTPANYLRFVTDSFYVGVLRTTVGIAAGSTALCLLFGVPIARRLARMQGRWKSTLMLLIVLPLFIGSTVRCVGWLVLFAHGGLIGLAVALVLPHSDVQLMFTRTAVVIGIVSFNLPYVVLTLQSVFEGIDTRLEDAASSLGAAPARAFWRIVWPLALPGVAIAGVLCFILAMNAFATPVLLGGPTFQMMAPLLFHEFADNNNWPFAAAMAFLLMATTLILTAASNILVPRRYRAN